MPDTQACLGLYLHQVAQLYEVEISFGLAGKEFNYTTHGFTLLSAVIEAVSGETFDNRMKRTFNQLGMDNTFLDENEPIITNRARLGR